MTEREDSDRDLQVDDPVAAEYVLGVLSFTERQQVEKRMRSDVAFARRVQQWENRLSGLNDDYHSVEPSASTFEAIEARLFERHDKSSRGFISSVWNSLAFWRGLSALSIACVIVGAVLSANWQEPSKWPHVAELSSPNGLLALIVSYDASSGRIALAPTASTGKSKQSLELWLIPTDGTPRSLGIFDTQNDDDIVIPVEMREQLRNGVTLAVSLEPFGGSPTGQPTGPVVASGTTRQL